MKYAEAVEYLESLSGNKKITEIKMQERLLEKWENPQSTLSFLYIDDANKSVITYAASVLKAAGYKVGIYMPSAAMEYRERFRVGGRAISQKTLIKMVQEMQKICIDLVTEGHPYPSKEEVESVLAFAYFKNQNCEIVLFYGDRDLIVADNITVVTLEEFPVAEKIKYGLEMQRFDFGEYKRLELRNAGVEQIENAAHSLAVVQYLRKQGFEISEAQLRKGLLESVCPGKFTVLKKKPYLIVDEAYDLQGIVKLSDSVKQYFADKRMVFIMSSLRDADCEKILEKIHSFADWIITVSIPGENPTMSSYELAAVVTGAHPNVTAVDSLEEAVEISSLLAKKEDVILAFGSPNIFKELCRIMGTQTGK